MFALQAVLDAVAQLGQRLQSERLGEVVIDRDRARRLHRARRHGESGVLAGQRRRRIGVGEFDIEGPAFAGLDAGEVVLEAGDELGRAEHDRHAFGGATLERLAVLGALERHRDPIALFGRFGLVCRFRLGDERPVGVGDPLQRLVDFGIGHLGGEPLQLDGLEIGERDRRQNFDLDLVGKVGFAFDHAFDRALVGHDLGLGGELVAVVGDDLAVGLAHRVFDHLGHGGLAIETLEVRDRNLARTEAAQLHLALEVVEPRVDLGLEIGRRHDDAEFALETRGGSFSHLHWHYSLEPKTLSQPAYSRPSFGKTARLVRAEGLEPPRLSSREPKSRASTNSATPATHRAARWRGLYHALRTRHYQNRSRYSRGNCSGKSSAIRPGPNAAAASPWSQTAAAAASKAGMPCANRPVAIPVSTSPAPAVAK